MTRSGFIPSRRGTASYGHAPSSLKGAIHAANHPFPSEVQSLVTFSEEVNTQRFFIAKDHGAYIGCSVGPAPSQKRLFFFKGCNPAVDKDFSENARRAFGGDDFGEHFPVADLVKMLAEPACMKVRVTVTRSSIRIDGLTG